MDNYYNYNMDQVVTTTTSNPEAAAAVAALSAGFFVSTLLLAAAIYVIYGIFLGKIFKKAGVDAWIAWVPFYNTWKLLEIGGQPGFWAVLAIVPPLSIVTTIFMYISMYHIGKKLGKDDVFVLLAIFLPVVWIIWLGVDKSTWNDKASTAQSLHKKAA